MAPNPKLTILAAQQSGAPLPTVVDADDQQTAVDAQMQDSFVARAAGWCEDSDGDYDDD